MTEVESLLAKLKLFGVGRRKLDDPLFIDDKPPPRLGVYAYDDEILCHEVIKSTCNIPGCKFTTDSLLQFENHYNATHRYSCAQCKKVLPSPHLLDLHIQETHDSFFAVMAERKPSYCCYIEECKEKFQNPEERLDHCVNLHKLPKDFRFEQKPKSKSNKKGKSSQGANTNQCSMDVDNSDTAEVKTKIVFTNNKQRTFTKYTVKKFTKTDESNSNNSKTVNIDEVMADLKESLP